MKSLDVFLSQTFLSLETFLQKTTTLNIFEALIFNYKIKVDSVEHCSPQFVSFVVDLCNELQLILRENVVEAIDKPECVDKSDTSFCHMQPVNPTFVEFSSDISTDQAIEFGSKEEWTPSNCPNVGDEHVGVKVTERTLTPIIPVIERQKHVYSCDFCNRRYRTSDKLSKHVCKSAPAVDMQDEESVHDPDLLITEPVQTLCESEPELAVYVCAGCFSTYSKRELFDQHTHVDNSQEVALLSDGGRLQSQRKFSCGVCCEVYRSLARISYHVARCRAGPYQCELCTHVAATKQLLNRHKKKYHKGVESFFCAECGLGFKLRTSLQKHQVNRHETECHHFPCESCGQTFPKKIQLTNHRIEVHGVERKFLCQVCGHKFMTQDSLTCHLECHSNRRRFQCRYCSKPFKTKEKMTLHVRTHTGEKPFVCERQSCGKSFVSKSKLTQHLQRHSGERRHKCGVCGKQYANKPDLRAHLRKLHSAEDCVSKPAVVSLDHEPPQVIPSQLYNTPVQFYPVSVPQSLVIASYQTVVGHV